LDISPFAGCHTCKEMDTHHQVEAKKSTEEWNKISLISTNGKHVKFEHNFLQLEPWCTHVFVHIAALTQWALINQKADNYIIHIIQGNGNWKWHW
jgi:hypothetical protein